MSNKPLSWYTDSLHRTETTSKAIFRCPVCLQDINDENQFTQNIVNAHIIPKALGGKSTTYVCRKCDSNIGSVYEGPIINTIKDQNILQGKSTGRLRGKLEYVKNNIVCPAQLNFQKGWKVNLPRPGDAQYILDKIPQDGIIRESQKLNFLYQIPKRADNIALFAVILKIAYLGAFCCFGYDYILHSQLDWVRIILKGSGKVKFPYNFAFLFPPHQIITKDYPFLIFDGTVNELNSLLCVIKFNEKQVLVLLPPRNHDLPNNFKAYATSDCDKYDITLSVNVPALALLF